jgi:hypothetical protein
MISEEHKKGFYRLLNIPIHESFQTKREVFIRAVGDANTSTVDRYLEAFKIIRTNRYPALFHDSKQIEKITRRGFDIPVDKRHDIDSYPNFQSVQTIVDYVYAQTYIEKTPHRDQSGENTTEVSGRVIYEDNNIQIFYGNNARGCIRFKEENTPMSSWCISNSTPASNAFGSYRYGEYKFTIYFVKSKHKTTEDRFHVFVVQVTSDTDVSDVDRRQYQVTSSRNDGDIMMTWKGILSIEPKLENLQKYFKPVPISGDEENKHKEFKHGSRFDYCGSLYATKLQYIDANQTISDEYFLCTPDDLKKRFIEKGQTLTTIQYNSIKDNKELINRYATLCLRKFLPNIDGTEKQDPKLHQNDVLALSRIDEETLKKVVIPKLTDENLNTFFLYFPSERLRDGLENLFLLVSDEQIDKSSSRVISQLLSRFAYSKAVTKKIGEDRINRLNVTDLLDLVNFYAILSKPDADVIMTPANISRVSQKEFMGVTEKITSSSTREEKNKYVYKYILRYYGRDLEPSTIVSLFAMNNGREEEFINEIGREQLEKLTSKDIRLIIENEVRKFKGSYKNYYKILGEDILDKLEPPDILSILEYLIRNDPKNIRQNIEDIIGYNNIEKLPQDMIISVITYSLTENGVIEKLIKLFDPEVLKQIPVDNIQTLINRYATESAIDYLITAFLPQVSKILVTNPRDILYYLSKSKDPLTLIKKIGGKPLNSLTGVDIRNFIAAKNNYDDDRDDEEEDGKVWNITSGNIAETLHAVAYGSKKIEPTAAEAIINFHRQRMAASDGGPDEDDDFLYYADSFIQSFEQIAKKTNRLNGDIVESALEVAEELRAEEFRFENDKNTQRILKYKDRIINLLFENAHNMTLYAIQTLIEATKGRYGDVESLLKKLTGKSIDKFSPDYLEFILQGVKDPEAVCRSIVENKKEIDGETLNVLLKNSRNILMTILTDIPTIYGSAIKEILFRYKSNITQICDMITPYIKNTDSAGVSYLLFYASDPIRTAQQLGKNLSKLERVNVLELLRHTDDKPNMMRAIGSRNLNKLSDDEFRSIFLTSKEEFFRKYFND